MSTLRFVFLQDPKIKLDSLKSGSIQAAFLQSRQAVAKAMRSGFGGFQNAASPGRVAVINASEGRPGVDPRVRKAMFQAIDTGVLNQRAHAGAGKPSRALFPPFSRWHTDVAPLPHDPTGARKLLAAAKADGYDGKVTYTAIDGPSFRKSAVAIKAMLEKVGFEVKLDLVRSTADVITKVAAKQNYDVADWGIEWRDAAPYPKMYATQDVHGDSNVGMYTSQAMSTLMHQFKTAESEEAKRAIAGKIQKQWNEDVPALVFGANPNYIAISGSLHGVTGSSRGIVFFDGAWLA